MVLFDSVQKKFLNNFKLGDFGSEFDRKSAVSEIKSSGKSPVKTMINLIGSLHASESNKERVRVRMTCLEEILDADADPVIVSMVLDVLSRTDSYSLEFLSRILKRLYRKELTDLFMEHLKSGKKEIREVVAGVLSEVGGKTAFDQIRRKIQANAFQSCPEALEAVCGMAGHHAIPVLQQVLEGNIREDRLKALELLADPKFMKIRQRRALETALVFINDPDDLVRNRVITFLGQHGEREDWQILIPLMQKEEKKNLQAVIDALGDLGDTDSIPYLVNQLESRFTGIKLSVINALEKFEHDLCVEPLVEALRDPNILIRQRTIEILGKLGRSNNVRLGKLLITMMKDRDVNIRRSVVEVMRIVGNREEIWWKLIRYLRDEDWWVRERIIDILAELGGEKILDPVASLLKDPSEIVRRYAIELLIRLGDIRAVDHIMTCVNDEDWWVRERAVEALGELGGQRAVGFLNRLLEQNDELLWSVVTALQKIGDSSSYLPLMKKKDHPLPEYRIEIIKTLDLLGDKRFADDLELMMHDEDKTVRDYVVSLLPKYNLTPTEIGRRLVHKITPALLDQMLLEVRARNGEDLFLIAGSRPMLKIRGDVSVLDDYVFTPDETEKLLNDVMSPIQREQFDSMDDIDMSYIVRNEGSRFRVNIYRTRTGICAVFRAINQEIIKIQDLGLPPPVIDFSQLKQGLVLVTGPTGSGKSTTLAAMIDYMNITRNDHIITIEDPIEYMHKNNRCIINQRELGAHTRSFSSALRSALREDPDVILVGEMRDLETISIAITAAETGHLVLGTLHTISAAKTIDRIIDVFPGKQQAQVRAMLSESLRGVLSQQLIKRKNRDGRVLALELMICNDAIANLIRKEKIFQIPSVLTTHYEQGMTLMDNELMRLVREDAISPEDAFTKSINKKEFEQFLHGEGVPGF